jgi:hypothetical protein
MTEREAFEQWCAGGVDREEYRGAFVSGWVDRRLRKGDFRRRIYKGDAVAAYQAGRMQAARAMRRAA